MNQVNDRLISPMADVHLTSNEPILLIGAGPAPASVLKSAHGLYQRVVCADGGLAHAQAAGIVPDLVVGDLDSVDLATLGPAQVVQTPDQNLTDFEKALAAVDAPAVLAAGVLGGRLDHQLATFSTLVKTPRPVVAFDGDVAVFQVPPLQDVAVPVPKGAPVALYPLVAVTCTSQGVRYPLDDAAMAPDGLISTSNHMAADTWHLHASGPGLLAIVPVSCLPDLVQVFAQVAR